MEINLSEEEKYAIKSMSRYWEEVSKREDTTPLNFELQNLVSKIWTENILAMVKYCIDDLTL